MGNEWPGSIENWQEDFDEWFPKGAIVIRMVGDPDGDNPTYNTPQITVLDLVDTMPRIYFAAGYDKGFLLTLVSWKQVHQDPDVFAAADSEGKLWRFSNAVSDSLAAELVPLRGGEYLSRDFILATMT